MVYHLKHAKELKDFLQLPWFEERLAEASYADLLRKEHYNVPEILRTEEGTLRVIRELIKPCTENSETEIGIESCIIHIREESLLKEGGEPWRSSGSPPESFERFLESIDDYTDAVIEDSYKGHKL